VGTLQELADLGVGFVSLTEALDMATATGRAMAGLLSVFAQFEHDLLRDRVRAGLAEAKLNGKKLGRPRTRDAHSGRIRKLYLDGISKAEIARRLNLPRTTVRRVLAQDSQPT
jgi:DNA invertase Pin-like site-specific DNA recombinase